MPQEVQQNNSQNDEQEDWEKGIRTPTSEEESPNIVSRKSEGEKNYLVSVPVMRGSGIFGRLPVKDSSAYLLTIGCILLIAIMWGINVFTVKDSEFTSKVVDLLKYVVTASLGFFFGTSRNEEKNKGKE